MRDAGVGNRDRVVYVISDLHIGGDWAAGGDRGFRMMTNPEALAAFIDGLRDRGEAVELVINGDFIDFLAEDHLPDADADARWQPFLWDPDVVEATLRRILTRPRDARIFEALGALVAAGHQLTILLGNHDLELSLPRARAVLAEALGTTEGHGFRFLFDGEAYEPAHDVLIEHGNRYDPANVVDHDALRRLRSLQSRRQPALDAAGFVPPAGSRLVASVMNPLKAQYAFLDLLKPESEPLFALLLALEPDARGRIVPLAPLLLEMSDKRMQSAALPGYAGDIHSAGGDAEVSYAEDIGLRSWLTSKLGVLRLLLNGNTASVRERIPMIRQALRALEGDRTFDETVELATRYRDAAAELAGGDGEPPRYRYIVFGHTHHARRVELAPGVTYLNTGTWANLMRFPAAISAPDEAAAEHAIWQLLEDLRANQLERYIEFRPTYVRIAVDATGHASAVTLERFRATAD